MPRIPGYNYNIHLEDGFDCCEAELAILKNQTAPAKLDNLESVEDAGDNSYVFVDDGGTKKKVLLKDLINSSLNPQLAEITRRLDVHRDRLDRDRALEWVQLNALKKLTKTKQDKLVAGDGIKIDGNTISATVALDPEALKNLVTKEDFDKYSDYIESILVSTNDKLDALSDWLTEVDENKQDKLIAGENITIDENNVISAKGCDCTGCKIGIDFVTNIAVGHLPAGTQISKDTLLSDLLHDILYQEGSDNVTIGAGKLNNHEGFEEELKSFDNVSVGKTELLDEGGVVIQLPSVDNQYLAITTPGDIEVVSWIDIETNFPLTFVKNYGIGENGNNVFFINEPNWDNYDDGKVTQPAKSYKFVFRAR